MSPVVLASIIGIPIALILGVILVVVNWNNLSQVVGLRNPIEAYFIRAMESDEEEVDVLATITDLESAENAADKLTQIYIDRETYSKKAIDEYHQSHKVNEKNMSPEESIKAVMEISDRVVEETKAAVEKYKDRMQAIRKRKGAELKRINKIPGLKQKMQTILSNARMTPRRKEEMNKLLPPQFQ